MEEGVGSIERITCSFLGMARERLRSVLDPFVGSLLGGQD
jgi:hypothetical protein